MAGEAQRMLAPDGRIVLIGQDWDTVVIDAGLPGHTHVRDNDLLSRT